MERIKYFKEWKKYCLEIKKLALKFFNKNFHKIIIFGSLLKGEYVPSISDIDIAIVLEKHEKEKEIKFKVLIDKIFEDNPFEIHFLDINEWNFFKKQLDKYLEL